MRLDVLLFELRLFKSRTQAASACQLDLITLNGAPAKPSREVNPGDRIHLDTGRSRTLEILELPHASLSKSDAARFYREIAEGDIDLGQG
jgi:ribosome-associated heat shock protein Hsp15